MLAIRSTAFLGTLVVGMTLPRLAAAQVKIDVELATDEDFSGANSRDWYDLFTSLKVDNLRIRSGKLLDEVKVESTGEQPNATYKVIGRLTRDNQLILPGGTYSARDKGRIKAWLDDLRAHGPEGEKEATPFGLSAEQLTAARKDLGREINFETKDAPLAVTIEQIAKRLDGALVLDPVATADVATAEVPTEELKGLAVGTALSYLVRSLGLAVIPRANADGKLAYHVERPATGADVWPIGARPEKRPRDIVPSLYEISNVNIEDFPLADVAEAIAKRAGARVLYDHYSLARFGVDVHEVKVTVRGARMSDQTALRQALTKARLRFELRVDEAGQPLFWITSNRRDPDAKRSSDP